jgi:hypothetical protein
VLLRLRSLNSSFKKAVEVMPRVTAYCSVLLVYHIET